jgi:hypothetical protein
LFITNFRLSVTDDWRDGDVAIMTQRNAYLLVNIAHSQKFHELACRAGDWLTGETKCETVSAVLSNPSATRGQVATAMEMGRNNGCFGTGPPRREKPS